MSNMIYCRFRNTLDDVSDCLDALSDGYAITSIEEQQAAWDMLDKVRIFLAEYDLETSQDVRLFVEESSNLNEYNYNEE